MNHGRKMTRGYGEGKTGAEHTAHTPLFINIKSRGSKNKMQTHGRHGVPGKGSHTAFHVYSRDRTSVLPCMLCSPPGTSWHEQVCFSKHRVRNIIKALRVWRRKLHPSSQPNVGYVCHGSSSREVMGYPRHWGYLHSACHPAITIHVTSGKAERKEREGRNYTVA